MLPEVYTAFNTAAVLTEPYRLRPDRRYSWEEIADIWARSVCGDDHGLEYFVEHGYYHTGTRRARHSYPRIHSPARIPLYLEHFIDAGEGLRDYAQSRGIAWDTTDYTPVMEYRPCLTEAQSPPSYDLWVVNQKLPFTAGTYSAENPALMDLARRNGKVLTVGINRETAERKGIHDGEAIVLEAPGGKEAEGIARLTEGVHPECLAVPGMMGRRAAGRQASVGKGIHVNHLLTYSFDHMDTVSAALDSCVKVRVRPAGRERPA
jgi:molybdopterin-containing oxidoreductase family molybdopterin binding subunit